MSGIISRRAWMSPPMAPASCARKAWKKGDPEPEAWTIEVPHKTAHQEGSPGIFCFTPQDQRAWIDNISITSNQ